MDEWSGLTAPVAALVGLGLAVVALVVMQATLALLDRLLPPPGHLPAAEIEKVRDELTGAKLALCAVSETVHDVVLALTDEHALGHQSARIRHCEERLDALEEARRRHG